MNVAYLTDVEGIWSKLESFAAANPYVTLDPQGRLVVVPGARFVFGGDAIDRGGESMRVVACLLDAKLRQPDQVVLLAGNRDINKLRLRRELFGYPSRRAPKEIAEGPRAALLKWTFANTMAAPKAFELRRGELSVGSKDSDVDDEDVIQSFLSDLAPDGALARYLASAELAHREGETLFVHGAVTRENLFALPRGAKRERCEDLGDWVSELNAWYAASVLAFREQRMDDAGEPSWASLVAYQAPLPGTRLNQASVVYGRLADEHNNPRLPSRDVMDALARAGVARLVVGHTPSGDTPSLLRAESGFELLIADNSYGRVEEGSRVLIADGALTTEGTAELDPKPESPSPPGERVVVRMSLRLGDSATPHGKRDRDSGHLVKGQLASGDYLLFKGMPGWAMEQRATSPADVAKMPLASPEEEP